MSTFIYADLTKKDFTAPSSAFEYTAALVADMVEGHAIAQALRNVPEGADGIEIEVQHG